MIKKSSKPNIRVRFAPSPTGLLHVGSFRTALFNWLFARKNKGSFILRIEDTDRVRSKEKFLKSQLDDLSWMGLDWDEGPEKGGQYGPYSQYERLGIYKKFAQKLLNDDKAYYCYCTPEELKKQRKEIFEKGEAKSYSGKCRKLSIRQKEELEREGRKACIRFKSPGSSRTLIHDVIKGKVSFDNNLIEDFVIVKSDGVPTYNFAVVVDDSLMEISHVIRGDEHMSNTPKQAMLYDALGFSRPVFCHIPIILNPDKTKLSKRKGAVHLLEFKEKGYFKETLFNFLALLGWAPKNNNEFFSVKELISEFSLEGITKHPAVFDENKMIWMNGQYLKTLPLDKVISNLKPFLLKRISNPDIFEIEWYRKAVLLYRERAKTLEEMAESLKCYFVDIKEYDPKGVKKHFKHSFLIEALPELARRIDEDMNFNEVSLENILREYAQEIGQSAGKIIQSVRLSCTGTTASPPIFDVMVLMGKEKLIGILKGVVEFIKEYQESRGL